MSTKGRRGAIILILIFSPFVLGLLLTYQVIRIPLPTDMKDSIAVGYQEGPRLSPPEGAVSLQGESYVPGELPSNPVPKDAVSLQRGEILFNLHCALCHGMNGHGDGPLADYFARTPIDLGGSEASADFDGSVYLVILQGFGEMPSLAENLTVRERWDVINYIRTLPSGEE